MLWAALLVVAVGLPSLGESTAGPSFRAEQVPCDDDNECDIRNGEVCWKLYHGCYQGVCMCNPDTHVRDLDGKCRYSRYGNELCTEEDICLNSMVCRNGTCQCPRGEMTEEGNFCMMPRHRMLGQSCTMEHTCLQKSKDGYIENDVMCSRAGRCVCAGGYRQDGKSCKKLPAGASCTLMYECEGGFMCLNGYCKCPHNYIAVADKTKCANVNAIFDLPLGAHCDEINESRYCSADLICHRCHKERREKCVKYSLSSKTDTGRLVDSSSVNLQSSHVFLTLASLIGYILVDRR